MVSVIIPVYNGERTIERCVNSVLAQSYKDFELILVDDGSTDGTLELLDSFDDSRIVVAHKTNGGVSSARNFGLEIAKGEYVSFVDADDVVEEGYLYNLMQGSDYDLSTTGFYYGSTPPVSRLNNTKKILENKSAISKVLLEYINDDRLCFPWGRLYRSDIIKTNQIRFDERMRFAEDNVFVWQYLAHVDSAYFDFTHVDYHKMDDDKCGAYNLSFEEMDYVDGQLFIQKNNLEKSFGEHLNLDVKQLMHVAFLKDKLVLTASKLYDYFKKYHPNLSKEIGYDAVCSSAYYLALAEVKCTGNKEEALAQLRRIRIFLDCPFALLRYSSIKSRFLIPFIKLGMYGVVIRILRKI